MPTIAELLATRQKPQPPPPATLPLLDWYENAEGWKPTAACTLPDLIDGIKSEDFRDRVLTVRYLLAAGDKKQSDELKKQLPAVSLSGSITGRRKGAAEEGRFTHSGFLQIDIDAKDHPGMTLDAMRDKLHADPHIQAVFVSPSGTGVKAVARIPADVATHRAAFLTAEKHFAALGLAIDKSCKDPVRLCFVSHDPDAWLRPTDAAEFVVEAEPVLDDLRSADPIDYDDEEEPFVSNHVFSAKGGLVIRGDRQHDDWTLEKVREMLACIPYPGYDGWLKITNAVWDAIGEAGTAALQEWAPEKHPGDYAKKWKVRLKDVHAGSLVMAAKEHGWLPPAPVSNVALPKKAQPVQPHAAAPPDTGRKDKDAIPAKIFPVPTGEIGYDIASRHIFASIGPSNRLFMRGTTIHEVAAEANGDAALKPVEAERFCSLVETFGARVARREQNDEGIIRWRSVVFPTSSARVVMASDGSRESLPNIRQLVAAPIIIPFGERDSIVLSKGYHAHAGGTFITNGTLPPEVPLDEAVAMIQSLLEDFDFPDPSDASRAIASIISPALKIGGWIDDDFPLDIAEADQSQSGKTYRQKLVCAIYKEAPSPITQAAGGVGSLDEKVSTALICGRPFITFDNFRGRMDSTILESAIRGYGRVAARALRISADIDCSPFLWQLSTNGAELTRDLANRSIITRIRKRAADYQFTNYPEGDTLAHIRAQQPRFLGAVHAIIREWAQQGRPRTHESRHDFRMWCRTMDWIVQNIFSFPPLLDGHREEQLRTANPKLQWLREIVNAVLVDGYNGAPLTASDLAEAAEEHDITLPGNKHSNEGLEVRIGKVLGRLFKEAATDTLVVDGRRFTRQVESEWDTINRTQRERKHYVIEGFSEPKQPENDDEQQDLPI